MRRAPQPSVAAKRMAICGATCCAVFVAILAATAYLLSVPSFSTKHLVHSLEGQVAVVTGASRGIGKGIAIGLGEAGATVYVTGRTLSRGAVNSAGINGKSAAGSLEETCDMVIEAGGKCVPVAADNGKDEDLQGLFERVIKEQGRLDILVNNAFAAVSHLPKTMGKPFWEKGVETWDIVNNVGLRSHYVASMFATQHMSKLKRGLIINVGSFGGMDYTFDVAYGIGKAAMDRMANDMAVELFTENITMVSIWPGLVKTENIEEGALDTSAMTERRGAQPGAPKLDISALTPTPLAETPLFNGRAVAAFAKDARKMDYTGKVIIPSAMAYGYEITDERGVRTPPFFSLKFMLAAVARPLLEARGLWTVPGECYTKTPALSDGAKFFWHQLPDFTIPGKLMRFAGQPNF